MKPKYFGRTFAIHSHLKTSALALACAVAIPSVGSAATYTWDGDVNGDWERLENWNPNGVPNFDNTADIKIAGTVQLGQHIKNAKTIKSIEFTSTNLGATSIGLVSTNGAQGRNLTFSADSGNSSVTVNASATGDKRIGDSTAAQGNVILASDLDIIHNGASTLTFSTVISGTSRNITLSGTGTTVFSSASAGSAGANTYSGLTSVKSGQLDLGKTGVIAVAGNLTVGDNVGAADSAILRLLSSNQIATTSAVILNSDGRIALNGNANTVASLSSAGGNIISTVAGGNLTSTSAAAFSSSGNTIGAGATVTSSNAATLAASGTLAVNGTLASGLGIATGATLSGTGTVSGNTTVTGTGIINLGSGGNIGGTLGVSGGNWNGAGSVTGLVTSSSGTLTIGSGANLTANGNVNVTGGSIASGNSSSTITGSVNYTSGSNSTYGGVIAGSGKTLTLNNASATLTLSGTNTYNGATNISAGTLIVDGSLAAGSAVTLSANSTLAGGGTVAGSITVNGGTLSPGNSPGTMTTGSQTWNSGNYNWQVLDVTGVAGTGYDTYAMTGTLDLTNLSAGGFGINLWSLSSIMPDANGPALNFNDASNYQWTLASTSGGVTGFDAANFLISTAANNGTVGFANLFTGTFSVSTDGSNLFLNYAAVPEPAAALLGSLGMLVLLRRRRA